MPFRRSTRALMATPPSEKGFVLPVVLGVGVITILLGVMMIERSSQNRISAIAQKANVRSVAVAEHGVTQFQALLNRYRPLATACSDVALSAFCGSAAAAATWSNLANATLNPCSTDSTQPITLIQSYATQQWSNATANPVDGQFRLVSYQYQPDAANPTLGTGTLIVQGRINPDDAIRTATAQLKVNFNVTRNPGLGNFPGLWIKQNQTASASDTAQILTHVRDSTCPGDAASTQPVQQLQNRIQNPYAYQTISAIDFPELSPEGTHSPSSPQPGISIISALENQTKTLPNPSQPGSTNASNGILTYRVQANNGQSINLTNPSSVLTVGTGSETVVLTLDGGLTLTGGGRIQLASGSSLIIYAHGPVTLAGNKEPGKEATSAIEQDGTPSSIRTQLYVYPPQDPIEPAHAVSLEGESAAPLYLVLVAPTSIVKSSAHVQGSIWAKSWQGEGSAAVVQDPLNASDLKLLWSPRISPITAWQRGDS